MNMGGKRIAGITLIGILAPLLVCGMSVLTAKDTDVKFFEGIGILVTIFYGATVLAWLLWVCFWLLDDSQGGTNRK